MNGFWFTLALGMGGAVGYALAAGRPGMRKEYRDEAQGLADLLRYARPIEPGILLGKGGELIAGFFYRGTDTESASHGKLEAIAARLNDILRQFGSGWMLHIDANRIPVLDESEPGEFPSAIAKLMDLERARQYNQEGAHFESRYALILTYLPPLQLHSKANALMFDKNAGLETRTAALRDQIVARFKDQLSQCAAQFSALFDGFTRMGEQSMVDPADGSTVVIDSLASYLHYCVTGIVQPIAKPAAGGFYDTLIGSQDFVGGNTPRIGRKHIRPIAIEGFPAASTPAMLAALNEWPLSYRWSTRFIFMDAEEGKSALAKLRKKWRQKVRGLHDQAFGTTRGPLDQDALAMEADAQTAMSEAGAGLVRYGHYTSAIVLMDEDEARLKQNVEDVIAAIRALGFAARLEDLNAVEAFLGTLPGHGYENVRRPILHTLNLAHLLPTTAIWPGLAYNPCPFYPSDSPPLLLAKTIGHTPFRFNLHIDDVGHTLMMGPTGAGKSTHLALIEASFLRYPRARIRKFDKGYSSFVLCHALGGVYYDIGNIDGAGMGFCPLRRVDQPMERLWAEDYLETLLTLQGFKVLPAHRNIVRHALRVLGEGEADRRSMTEFVQQVQDTALRQALEPYTLTGGNPILDDIDDRCTLDAPYLIFEMEPLMEMGEKYATPVLLYLFRCIERNLDGAPTLLVLDEAWLMLRHPIFQEKIRAWLKVLRKANCAVVFATQSISDVETSALRDVIFESCPTKILLANPEVNGNEDCAEHYRALGLNPRQIDLIGHMVKKRDYYYLSPLGRRKYQLGLGPLCLAFTGISGKDDIARARRLIQRHGPRWTVEWLKHCNQHEEWGKGRLTEWIEALECADLKN